jgi:glycosyltransferase involved in cell wall biosynthesis
MTLLLCERENPANCRTPAGRIEHVTRVLIDITRLMYRRIIGRRFTGIDRVGLEYLRHFSGRAHAVLSWEWFAAALSVADSALAFSALLDGGRRVGALEYRLAFQPWIWAWLRGPARGSLLLDTSHTWLDNPSYAWLLRRRGARPVFFVHDLIPISHPEYCRPGEAERHEARMRNALTIGCGVVVNSNHTLETLQRFAHSAGLQMPRAVVALLAPGVAPSIPGLRPIEHPYFVILGTIEPRKNHWLLLQAWRRLVERMGDSAPRLFVVGQRGWECENVVDLLERCSQLEGFVFERNACSDAELATLLHHAQALLMPSFAEGFGLPVAEALAAGVPVIASDLAVFREIAGTIPEFVAPLDGRRWMELILDYTQAESARRAAQLARIGNFRRTAWAQHFDIVDRFLETLQ